MLLLERSWNAVRTEFSEAEKARIRRAIVGEVICPRGWALDDASLPPELLSKLKEKLK